MSLKKKSNHSLEHQRSLKALSKANLNGIIITSDGENTITSLIGGAARSKMVVHYAMMQVNYLRQMAGMVTDFINQKVAISEINPQESPKTDDSSESEQSLSESPAQYTPHNVSLPDEPSS